MRTIALAITALGPTTAFAMAQDKVQITYSGMVSVERLSYGGYSETWAHSTGDVGLRWPTSSGAKIGVNLGVETFHSLDYDYGLDGLTAYYAAAVLENRFGKISVGMPHGVMGDYFTVPAIGGTYLSQLTTNYGGPDFLRYVKLLLGQDYVEMTGVRYDGKIGQIDIGASVNKFNGYSANLKEVVAHYARQDWSVSLGASFFDQGDYVSHSTNLEVQGRKGKMSGGIILTKSDDYFLEPDSTLAFVSYHINDQIKLNAQVTRFEEMKSEAQTIYAIDLSYTHPSGGFISAGVFNDIWGNADNDTHIVDVAVGYKF
ncbi:MAG: porin [Pseudomonadota bacterium]